MPGIANVALTDTFDTWRITTNKLIIAYDQSYGFVTNTANDLANSVNVSIASVINSGNNANVFAMKYANTIGNTSNIYAITYAMQYANNISDLVKPYANSIGNSSNSYANASFTTLANGALIFGRANLAFTQANIVFGQANIAYTQANDAYTRANTRVATVAGSGGRITSSGTTAITLDLATSGAGAASYTGGISAVTVDAYGRVSSVTGSANYQPALGFTPVRQGGGTGQLNNTLYMGWSGAQLLLQIDATNFAATWPISISGSAASATSATFATAATSATSATNSVNATNLTGTQGLCGYSASGQSVAFTSTGGPQVMASSSGASMLSFHRPGIYAVNFGLDTDNILKVGGWSMGGVSYPVLHSGNYNSYAPSLTGTGASGTWGINITGDAGNGRTLLNTINLNNSASAADITTFSSSYTFFDIELINVVPVTNGTILYMRVYSGGAYQATSYNTTSAFGGGGLSGLRGASAAAGPLTFWAGSSVYNAAAFGGVTGSVTVANPVSNTTSYKNFKTYTSYPYTGWINELLPTYTNFQWTGGTGAVTGFQLFFSSGNIASGQVRIYGYN